MQLKQTRNHILKKKNDNKCRADKEIEIDLFAISHFSNFSNLTSLGSERTKNILVNSKTY